MNSVMTYNIKNDSPTPDPCDLWVQRLPKMVRLLQRQRPQLLGLQEVTAEQLADLQAELPNYHFVGQARSMEPKSEFNPIAYNHEQFSLVESDTFWLSETPNEMRKADEWQADCFRIATWATLQEKKSQATILMINTHFDHISEQARRESANVIKQFIEQRPETNVILMGDLNAEREETCYTILADVLQDVMTVSPYHVGPKKTCTGVDFKPDIVWDEMMQIDYIFISENVTVKRTEVVTDKIAGHYPSDHFPILCEFIV
ncbi:endonuclease/exonuclease/phosphatase family protein [Enterococcus sp. LJL99]